MIKVLLADDHAIVREGLKRILSEYPDLNVAAEAGTGEEVLKKIKENPVDVVVLDISLPDNSGLEILQKVKKINPKLPVLILSMYEEEKYGVRAFQYGAAGYLSKKSVARDLIAAIRKVATGSKYLNSSIVEVLATALKDNHNRRNPHESLSEREFQVMRMIASGKTITKIAKELRLAVGTIGTYRRRILEKMNLASNADITYYAVKERLID
ncbi:MAG: response regulator transcription factor [Candidatus Aminicenantales bacterium]